MLFRNIIFYKQQGMCHLCTIVQDRFLEMGNTVNDLTKNPL